MTNIYLILFLLIFSPITHSFSWQDLWLTPDQQGKQFMEKGNFKKAKNQFNRKDWAATAAYREKDFQSASNLFKQLNTADGFYNQGNSLAHLKQYKKALSAYDKAIELNPHHKDAKYNRKIVAELLKKT